ncbi:hypothetical protein ACFO4P_02855 [Epilithonimonas pallida]|uniref:Uncharacterized protein n=1 Tax=Epilithonimonas pallida TaxID=373671 RepID=A0ABY1R0S3_9FLAO|nr:hypothetical protein [Epilithonimonas pallida]SMP91353.1 hypothetical protein SAMN05421679_10346 [Epilithonimonas pallida]
MIETDISITINRKSDINKIEEKIIENKIRFPVYIREYEFSYQINFTSDYEEWELDTAILDCFPEYEYTADLEKGRKEIRIQISRYQSEFSTDGWGRRIENPLDETKYLVKKSAKKVEKFNPVIKVLFDDHEQYYYVNIVTGINKATEEQGFLLLDDFKTKNEDDSAYILKDKLYKSPLEAFHSGYYKIHDLVDADFSVFQEDKKKAIREVQKLPRKIIRDFINACNNSVIDDILKNLDENISFEKRTNYVTDNRVQGIIEFKKYLETSEQQLCGKNFKIRSAWSFKLPFVDVGVKYYPISIGQGKTSISKYEQIKFELSGNKIVNIVYES